FERETARLREQAAERKPVASQYSAEQLRQLALGVYVGIARDPAARPDSVRQVAGRWLAPLARGPGPQEQVIPALMQTLGDSSQDIRMQAFEQLQALGMDRTTLGAEALETGHIDLGVRALELLAGGASAAEGQAVLENALLTRKDDLALEAA